MTTVTAEAFRVRGCRVVLHSRPAGDGGVGILSGGSAGGERQASGGGGGLQSRMRPPELPPGLMLKPA
jgi:hypothetical protein